MQLHELEEEYENRVYIKNASTIFSEMRDIRHWCKEAFVAFYLDSQNRIISREILGIGILNSCIVHPREVFRTAIIRNSNAVILAHNHPSGSLDPSDEDLDITERLRKVGDIIGIKLLDHVIVSRVGYHSILN
jgi:DNA repair protein RadC